MKHFFGMGMKKNCFIDGMESNSGSKQIKLSSSIHQIHQLLMILIGIDWRSLVCFPPAPSTTINSHQSTFFCWLIGELIGLLTPPCLVLPQSIKTFLNWLAGELRGASALFFNQPLHSFKRMKVDEERQAAPLVCELLFFLHPSTNHKLNWFVELNEEKSWIVLPSLVWLGNQLKNGL